MKQNCTRLTPRAVAFCLFWLLVLIPVTASATSRFVFAVNYIAGSISTYRVDADTGMLHHIRFTPTLRNPSAMVLRPDGKFLYVTGQSIDEIAIYAVDTLTGKLTEIENSRVASGVRSNFRLSMSPDGKLLFVPGRFSANLMVYRSDPETGELTLLEDNNFPTHGTRARFVEVTPDGRFVYVTNTVSGAIAAYRVDSNNGLVSPIEGMPFRAGGDTVRDSESGETLIGDSPQQAIVHPSGKFLYVPLWITAEMAGFRIDSSTGVLTPIPDFKAETGVFPFSGSIHPSGKYLYVANWLSWDVSTFRIDENTGQLSPLDEKPISVLGDTPVNVHLDAEGRFAYVPNYHHSTLTVFNVDDQTGQLRNPRLVMSRPAIRYLSILEGEPVRYQPRWMVTSDYKKENNMTAIRSYAVDAQTGEPATVDIMEVKGETNTLALQEEAGLMFVGEENHVSVIKLSGKGQLQNIANKHLALDGKIQSLYVDQRGKHLYVATSNPARYLAYEINAEEGGLKEVERVELPEGTQPTQITSSPDQRLNFVLDKANNRVFVYRFLTRFGPNMFELYHHGSPFTMKEDLTKFIVDATGQYGLALSSRGSVTVYQLPHVWAPLEKVGKTPLAVGKKPVAITMHPDGDHFYVVDAGANMIHQLHLDTGIGKLTNTGKVVSVKTEPQDLVIDPSGRYAYLRYKSQKSVTRFNINPITGRLEQPMAILDGKFPSSLKLISEIQ